MSGFGLQYLERVDADKPAAAAAAVAAAATAVVRPPGRTEERLLRHLFGGDFDVDARGVDGNDTTVTVRIQFVLLRIQGLVSRSCHYLGASPARRLRSPAAISALYTTWEFRPCVQSP